jgi:hypothetical protein
MFLERRSSFLTKFPEALFSLLLFIAPFSSGQPKKPANDRTILTISQRRALARPILLHAESVSSAYDPTAKATLLYRAAGAWFELDPSHATSLYVESFEAARDSDPRFRADIETQILNELMSISPVKVLDLLKDADPRTQGKVYRSLMDLAFVGRDNGLAIRVFARAIQYYKAHPDTARFHWGLANLIAGSYEQLPSDLVLRAIDVVLVQGEELEKQEPGLRFSMNGAKLPSGFEFHSNFDFQLFAVIPVMRRLDPSRAAALLSQHSEVDANIKQFPEGLRSLDELGIGFSEAEGGGPDVRVAHHLEPEGLQGYDSVDKAPKTLAAQDLGLEFTTPRDLNSLPVTGFLRSVSDIGGMVRSYVNVTQQNEVRDPSLMEEEVALFDPAGSCPADISHLLAGVNSSPITRKLCVEGGGPLGHGWCSHSIDMFPRASLLQAVAERCAYYRNPEAARQALRDQLAVIDQIPETDRLEYLLVVADLYLRLGDRPAAADAVAGGFAAAQAVYARDSGAASLENVPRLVWASAEAYRRVITLGVNADRIAMRTAIDQIPNPVLAELERVMMARSLLGVPVREYLIAYPRNGYCVVGVNAACEVLPQPAVKH